ncbi:MAG: tail assembly protein [Psychrobacter pacificensis]|uniref:tail assembly protein n=1 Tax=Psychrobacter pacificensis TaxID=112002 RepID=UPI002383CCC0|nr:tail assembly protein [Psychrobacter pacificensis]MDE0842529.1 tail assembly protein [Psychrobacter pacificensis]
MLRRIELHGILAEKFGKSFDLAVSSPREACQALSYQVDGFKQFMANAHKDGLFFAVFNDDENISDSQIGHNTGASIIRIVPEIVGAGGDVGGWLQVVAGAALVGVGVFVPGMQWAIGAGVGLMIGGAATLLMPTPNIEPQDEAGNKASYAFGGAVTTTAEGNCVPLLLGRRKIGGHLISLQIVNEDL